MRYYVFFYTTLIFFFNFHFKIIFKYKSPPSVCIITAQCATSADAHMHKKAASELCDCCKLIFANNFRIHKQSL